MSSDTQLFHQVKDIDYLKCSRCKLVFVAPGQRLNPEEEKSRYDLHENDPEDPNYRKFLSQLFDPLNKKLPPKSFGLDYGSGPGPTLHLMFEEAGHYMNIFDPFYDNDPVVLNNTYDFITTTETAEHFFEPGKEFNLLWTILKKGGYLGVMTKLLKKPEHFADWHYKEDDTHVAFYSEPTFQWIARHYGADVEIFGERTIILKKH